FAIIVTVILASIAPWFGRQALTWVVDMSSIGVSIAYFYTCFTAFRLFKWNNQSTSILAAAEVGPVKKLVAFVGMVVSFIFILLLLLPKSSSFMGNESLICLVIWVVLGIIFYVMKRKEYNAVSKKELNYLILDKRE